jgi:hypothetical protein
MGVSSFPHSLRLLLFRLGALSTDSLCAIVATWPEMSWLVRTRSSELGWPAQRHTPGNPESYFSAGTADRPRNLLIATSTDEGNQVWLSVRDSGVGTDLQSIEKLFYASYTTRSHRMGIGLSFSRSIVESDRGRLWANVNDGSRATSSFSIPCRSESARAR